MDKYRWSRGLRERFRSACVSGASEVAASELFVSFSCVVGSDFTYTHWSLLICRLLACVRAWEDGKEKGKESDRVRHVRLP